ncbi:MAG: head-tail connector protein [Alphaproteobacteria bacterium GM202ARS2]|nr:head-tail connector protein [Alphaproteobacteria bacterium GM202ARS2]
MKESELALSVVRRFQRARAARGVWEGHWRDCYDYALPHRSIFSQSVAGSKRRSHIYDGTALDAVEQLSASMMAHLTPPWSRWFGLVVGEEGVDVDDGSISTLLQRASMVVQSHFDRSNFAVEMHQCYLDLVVAGTACLMFEEAPTGSPSAFHFTCVPLRDVVFEAGASGELDVTLRRRLVTASELHRRYPHVVLPQSYKAETKDDDGEARLALIDMVAPCSDGEGYDYVVVFEEGSGGENGIVHRGRFYESPFITFRWLKTAGELYGRSPVMKALPEIKTANKVVELILKNASIAVTGIWQAEDDGVLNPSNVRLVPGTIIPKAVGSRGLTPLEAPGRFDVSQLVLQDLRERIRQALLADRLGPPNRSRMTATEVLERTADLSRLLGATYGRLQNELLAPLVRRALGILRRRGEVESIRVDGQLVEVMYHAPLARAQRRTDAHDVLLWLETVAGMGQTAMAAVNMGATVRWLGERLGVPGSLMVSQIQQDRAQGLLEDVATAEAVANVAQATQQKEEDS